VGAAVSVLHIQHIHDSDRSFRACVLRGRIWSVYSLALAYQVTSAVCVCETYIGKPFGTRVVPQFTTEVAKPLTQ
jgi:hypothetical protein